jgi:hypothetical protein
MSCPVCGEGYLLCECTPCMQCENETLLCTGCGKAESRCECDEPLPDLASCECAQ